MRGRVIVGVMTISTDVDKLYDTDLTDAARALIAPMLLAARPVGLPRKINIRAVLNAIFYLLRTGCQWRLLPREFPGWSTVWILLAIRKMIKVGSVSHYCRVIEEWYLGREREQAGTDMNL
jgi:transposase